MQVSRLLLSSICSERCNVMPAFAYTSCPLVSCPVGPHASTHHTHTPPPRDWFQLTLKEGLTVYRDQEFSADMNSRPVKRIDDVVMLRSRQFAEDAGPMAHPIRPDSYMAIDNFYTVWHILCHAHVY